VEFGDGFRAGAAETKRVIVLGTESLAKHEVRGFHAVDFKEFFSLCQIPASLPPLVISSYDQVFYRYHLVSALLERNLHRKENPST